MTRPPLAMLCVLLTGLGLGVVGFAWLSRWPLAMPVTAVGHLVVPLAALAFCSVPIWLLGSFLLARMGCGTDRLPPVTAAAAAWALGSTALVALGLATLATGASGRVVWPLASVAGWGVTAGWLLAHRRQCWRRVSETTAEASARLRSTPILSWTSLLLLVAGLCLAAAVLPPNSRDELAYHLVLPAHWEGSGFWAPPTDNPHLLFPANVELLWGYALTVGGLTAPRMLTLLFAALTVALLWEWLTESVPEPALRGQCLVVLVVTPVAMTSAVACLVEWPLLFFLVLGWRASQLAAGGPNGGLTALAGISWGVALGCKYTAIPFVGALFVDWCLELDWRSRARAAFALVLAAAGFALPWWLRNGLVTGDPVFPLAGILRGDPAAASQATRLAEYVEVDGPWRLMPWAYHATVDPVADHRLHLLWPLLLPLVLVLGWRWRRASPWWAVVIATLAFAPFTPSPRVELPLLVLVWLFLPHVLKALRLTRLGRAGVGLVTLTLLGLSLPFSLHHLFVAGPGSALSYLLGQQDRTAYLRGEGLLTPVVERVRSGVPESARVWAWCEDRTFYLERWARADSPYGPPAFLRALRDGGPGRISEEIRRDRVDYVLLNRRSCPESWRSAEREDGRWDLSDDEVAGLEAWASSRLREVERDPRYLLFAVDR